MSPESMSRVAALRQKAIAGTITQEEMIEAVKILRADRTSAVVASGKKAGARAAKVAAVSLNGDDLLGELM